VRKGTNKVTEGRRRGFIWKKTELDRESGKAKEKSLGQYRQSSLRGGISEATGPIDRMGRANGDKVETRIRKEKNQNKKKKKERESASFHPTVAKGTGTRREGDEGGKKIY